MYSADDPRSQLAASGASTPADNSIPISAAYYRDFHDSEPDQVSELGSKTWVTRGQNCLISWTDAVAGESLRVDAQPDEYMVLLFDRSAPIRVSARASSLELNEGALVIVPPGQSEVAALAGGPIIRVFSTVAESLNDSAANSHLYEQRNPRCAELAPWPDPVDGFALRVYRLADAPSSPDRFGRIFRSTNLMVNFLPEELAPRNPKTLSPHHHDDFEQLSLAVQGTFVHHIRYPWGPRSDFWRDDEHVTTSAPSLAVIPPPAEHTTQGIGSYQQLIDIFSPPRQDFSAQPGWVLNAEDYPAP